MRAPTRRGTATRRPARRSGGRNRLQDAAAESAEARLGLPERGDRLPGLERLGDGLGQVQLTLPDPGAEAGWGCGGTAAAGRLPVLTAPGHPAGVGAGHLRRPGEAEPVGLGRAGLRILA